MADIHSYVEISGNEYRVGDVIPKIYLNNQHERRDKGQAYVFCNATLKEIDAKRGIITIHFVDFSLIEQIHKLRISDILD